MKAAQDSNHWQAAAWLLERKYPEEFAKRSAIVITDKMDKIANAITELGKDEDIEE